MPESLWRERCSFARAAFLAPDVGDTLRKLASRRSEGKAMPALLGTRIPMASLVQAMAVAEHRSFTHAAAALGITQSSVSMRVRALEDELGLLLFERRPRGVRLTDAGRRFINEIAAGIGQLDYAIWIGSYVRLTQMVDLARSVAHQSEYMGQWTDDYTAIVRAVSGDETWTVSDYGRVAPVEIWALEVLLHNFQESIEWVPTSGP